MSKEETLEELEEAMRTIEEMGHVKPVKNGEYFIKKIKAQAIQQNNQRILEELQKSFKHWFTNSTECIEDWFPREVKRIVKGEE